MFRNYLLTALRNIARHKFYSFINIAGLAIGLTCVILIALFVRDELSYDKWIPDSGNLWRVEVTYHVPGQEDVPAAQTVMPLTVAMRDQIPEVLAQTRLARERMTLISGDEQFLENIGVVDPNFLKVIHLPLIEGNPATALSRPDGIVLTQAAAHKFFGDTEPVGKTLSTGRGGCPDAACANQVVVLHVVGVLRDLPHNTQFDFDSLIPNTSLADHIDQEGKQNWVGTNSTYGYVRLAQRTDPPIVLDKVKPILDRSIDVSRFTKVKIAGSQILKPRLTPLGDAHLTTDRYGGMKPSGSWTMLYGMTVIGMLILLVACFNFTNLATARATTRAREISLRKCVGAHRSQLIVQFLGEAVLMALIALILAFVLVEVLLPSYSNFMRRPLTFDYFGDWPLTFGVIAISVLAGLISGIYPALVLSGFRPAVMARADAPAWAGPGKLRSLLVVLQFSASIGLGIAALIVFRQIDFAHDINLGFNRDNIVITDTAGRLTPEGIDSFQQALEKGPGILGAARSSYIPFSGTFDTLPTQKPGSSQILSPTHFSVSPNYFMLYGIKILAGRALSDRRSNDEFFTLPDGGFSAKNEGHNVMINASLARALGYSPADIVGKTFIFGKWHMMVVGVAADTLDNGVRNPIMETVFVYEPRRNQSLSVRIRAGHTRDALGYISRTSRSFIHGIVLSQPFLSDNYEKLYQSDERQGRIFAIFVSITIVIACLGLFGLAAFTAGRRTKEIGIRKVFGARVPQIIWLLLTQFSAPVLLANLIAWPLAWYYLNQWLQGFAYRITLSPLYFLGVGLAALLIAWATVFVHALRVARASPIHALRYE